MSQLEFRGKHAAFLRDMTPEILVEGSLSSGKSTVGIWKELQAALNHPGIWILITRWTDDACKTLLKPAIEQLARILELDLSWNRDENYYALENGSRIFCFGLKTQSSDPMQKYAKIRGLPVSRILFDQAEQGPSDIAAELRFRLRPDIEARLKGLEYPRQLTFLANPVPDGHFLAREFPVSNKIKGRKLYSFSLMDNAHVLPAEMIESLLALYPSEHPKHATMILGERGLSVVGEAVYEGLFDRSAHVREVIPQPGRPLLEAFHIGTMNPCWVIGQRTFHGGLALYGGILSKRKSLDDFLSTVKTYRSDWFGPAPIKSCTAPAGQIGRDAGTRYTLVSLLRSQGFELKITESSNAPDVQIALIEEISARLRRRVAAKEEAITLNADLSKWLQVDPEGNIAEKPFLNYAFEGGFTWSEHTASVANKELKQPREDDEYANAMHCVEQLLLNFCLGQKTDEERRNKRRELSGEFKRGSRESHDYGWLAS